MCDKWPLLRKEQFVGCRSLHITVLLGRPRKNHPKQRVQLFWSTVSICCANHEYISNKWLETFRINDFTCWGSQTLDKTILAWVMTRKTAVLELSAQPAASSTVPRELLPIVHLVTLPSQQLFFASIALGRGPSRLLFQLSQTCEVYFSVSGASLLPSGKYASVGRKPQHERASLGPCAHGTKGRKSVQINLIELPHLSWGARTS